MNGEAPPRCRTRCLNGCRVAANEQTDLSAVTGVRTAPSPTYVLYHANCPDGFGGAWSVWLARGDTVTYCPVSHGEAPPEMPPGRLGADGRHRLSARGGPGAADRVRELVILDHHKSAQDELGDLDFATLDMHRLRDDGLELHAPRHRSPAADPLRPGSRSPRFELNSREVSAAPGSPMKFEVWSALDADDLARARRSSGFRGIRRSRRSSGLPTGARSAATALIVNATGLLVRRRRGDAREVPRAPFVGAYYEDADGARRWSLRSRPDFDVSEVAKQLGGGGHRAGVRLPRTASTVSRAAPRVRIPTPDPKYRPDRVLYRPGLLQPRVSR